MKMRIYGDQLGTERVFEVDTDSSVNRNTLSGWASSFHASRVNIAVIPRSKKLSRSSNDILMFINSLFWKITPAAWYVKPTFQQPPFLPENSKQKVSYQD
jgi:hypothetical protein